MNNCIRLWYSKKPGVSHVAYKYCQLEVTRYFKLSHMIGLKYDCVLVLFVD